MVCDNSRYSLTPTVVQYTIHVHIRAHTQAELCITVIHESKQSPPRQLHTLVIFHGDAYAYSFTSRDPFDAILPHLAEAGTVI